MLFKLKNFNQFHLVQMSPWPILCSISILFCLTSFLSWIKTKTLNYFSFVLIVLIMIMWWRDVSRESTFQGFHTLSVQNGLKIGMLLMILSEVMFFFSFFWTFFHASLAPSIELGMIWPPYSLNVLNPFHIPFLNTLVLVSSGLTVTWSHHLILNNKSGIFSLFLTVFLGLFFTFLQWSEYKTTSFTISDSVYGSVFFVATGFHGMHVLVGTLFLLVCLFRMMENHFSFNHLIGYELAIWYWHFVDVVWLFLFTFLYWWSE